MTRVFALALLAACDPGTGVVLPGPHDVNDEKPDVAGPEISHQPIDDSKPLGEEVTIVAEVVDDDGVVAIVEVFFKGETAIDWPAGRPMVPTGDTWEWTGAIPGDAVVGGGMDYYLLAVDNSGNESTYPEDGRDNPLHFRIDGG